MSRIEKIGNIVRMYIDEEGFPPMTEEEERMMEEAAKAPITYDEENPPLTDEQLKGFRRVGIHPALLKFKKFRDIQDAADAARERFIDELEKEPPRRTGVA